MFFREQIVDVYNFSEQKFDRFESFLEYMRL